MYCSECQENYDVGRGDRYCLVCGEEMREDVAAVPVQPAIVQDEENRLAALLDFFGLDLRGELVSSLSLSNGSAISTEFAASMGKVAVDERKGILYNCVLSLGPLKINAVSSSFGALPFDDILNIPLIKSIPEHGESPLLNAEAAAGAAVFMTRGCVTFAEKASRAADAGAVCLIVMQSADKWPFVMVDTGHQIGGDGFMSIPVLMVSNSDGLLLQKLIETNSKHTKDLSIRCMDPSKDCIICHEVFEQGEVVLKLPCAHTYHDECVMAWLQDRHTCPMCRHEMPAGPRNQRVSQPQNGDVDSGQSYFV